MKSLASEIKCEKIYEDWFYQLASDIVKGNGEYLSHVSSHRRMEKENLSNFSLLKTLFNEHYFLLKHTENSSLISRFKSIRNKKTLLFEPDHLLTNRIFNDFSSIFNFFNSIKSFDDDLNSEILRILNRSNIISTGVGRMCTSQSPKGPLISGRIDGSALSVIWLGHEIGHCLYDSFNIENKILSYLNSEIIAYAFENIISNELIKKFPYLKHSIFEYFGFIECFDNFMFKIEAKELFDLGKQTAIEVDLNWAFIRETYSTKPGYQVFYAISSFLRSKVSTKIQTLKDIAKFNVLEVLYAK